MYIKEPSTYEEQIESLRLKGFIIENDDICKEKLMQIRYYRLLAYLLPFKDKSNNCYFKGVPIERVYRIYDFDCRIRSLIFQCIEEIEVYLRSILSYIHSNKYGPLGYLNSENYNNRHNEDRFVSDIIAARDNNRKSYIVKWHEKAYNGNYPIWVIIEFFTFGMLSRFYSDFKLVDQRTIANSLHITNDILRSWLVCLTDLRNICAHYSRIYYWKFSATPQFPDVFSYSPQGRLFDYIIILKNLYTNKRAWDNGIYPSLQSLINEYSDSIKLNHIGFPQDWETKLNSCSI